MGNQTVATTVKTDQPRDVTRNIRISAAKPPAIFIFGSQLPHATAVQCLFTDHPARNAALNVLLGSS